MEVRRLNPEDWAGFREIRLEALKAHPEAFASSYADALERPDDRWSDQLRNMDVFAAFEAEGMVGLTGLWRETGVKTSHRGHVVMVYVREAARGKGAGRALLQAIVTEARRVGLQLLDLSVTDENAAACTLYEAAGFRRVGTIPGGLHVNGRYLDEHLYVLPL